MKYFISNECGTVYFMMEENGHAELRGIPINRDKTFNTDASFSVEFESLDDESFRYCKGAEAFLKRIK